jgi:hypothetical protein
VQDPFSARLPRWRAFGRWLVVASVTGPLGLAAFTGCGSSCDGVEIDGQCQAECKDELCATPGWRCFENTCRAPCSTDEDCSRGETCHSLITDHGTKGKFCIGEAEPPIVGTSGPCKVSDDCKPDYGYRCVDETCTLTCDQHAQCKSGSCTGSATDAEGGAVHVCEDDEFLHGKGQYGSTCPNIANDPSAGCDRVHDFKCLGEGPGDVDAYCAQQFCGSDDDCPAGFFCSTERAEEPPCEDVCDFAGKPTSSDCIHSDQIGAGKHYTCGPVRLLVNQCRHREFCNPCKSDTDCFGKPNQICAADQSGEKICTVLCDANLNSCPWGSAAVCGDWDKTLGKSTCAHRFGSCHGEGAGCEPCREDTDCPRGLCVEATFTGEKYCVDLEPKCDCPDGTPQACSGGGCPPSPSGAPLVCLGGDAYDNVATGKICFGANTDLAASSREGCWPSL